MKVKCPSCGKTLVIAEQSAQRLVTCSCKHSFKATPVASSPEVEAAEPDVGFEFESNAHPDETPDDTVSLKADELSDTQIDGFLSTLQKTRQEISNVEKKKSDDGEKSRTTDPKFYDKIDVVQTKRTPPIMEEPEEKTDPLPNPGGPSENTIYQIKQQMRERDARKKNPKAFVKADQEAAKKYAKPSFDWEAFARNRYVLTGAATVALTIVLVSWLMLENKKPPEPPADPYLTKLLTPAPAPTPIMVAAPPPSTPTADVPATTENKKLEVSDSPKKVAPAAPEEEEIVSPLLKKMQAAAFTGDYEHVIRLAVGNEKSMGEEERALLLEASVIRAGKNKKRLRDIYNRLAEERRDHPNASAFVRTQAAAMIFEPVGNKDLLTAIDLLRNLSLTRSHDPFVFAYAGLAYERIGQLDTAHANWEQAMVIEPEYLWVIEYRLRLYMEKQKWDKAKDMAERLVKLDGHAYQGYRKLAEINDRLGKKVLSSQYYRKALEVDGRAEARLELGNLLREQGKLEESIDQYRAGLRSDAGPALKRDLYYGAAASLCRDKRYDEGLKAITGALKLSAGANPYRIHYQKGLCELDSGATKKASQSFQFALKANPRHSESWLAYATSLRMLKNPRAAVSAYQRSLQIHETDRTFVGLAQAYLELGNKKDARVAVLKALKINPKNKDAAVALKRTK